MDGQTSLSPAARALGYAGLLPQIICIGLILIGALSGERSDHALLVALHCHAGPRVDFVGRRIRGAAIDQGIQIGMFHAQFDQLSVGRVEAGFQGRSATSMAKMPQAGG